MASRILSAVLAIIMLIGLTPSFVTATELPKSKLKIHVPDQVVYGHRNMLVELEIINRNPVEMPFTGTFWLGGNGWGKENMPYYFSSNMNVDNQVGSPQGFSYTLRGNIMPQSKGYFGVPTFSGVNLGSHEVARANLQFPPNSGIVVNENAHITLVEGRGRPKVELYTSRPWVAGQYISVQFVMTSPTLTQFSGDTRSLTNTCVIEGLNGSIWNSPAQRTQHILYTTVHVPQSAKGRTCEITGNFRMSNGQQVPIQERFQVQ